MITAFLILAEYHTLFGTETTETELTELENAFDAFAQDFCESEGQDTKIYPAL